MENKQLPPLSVGVELGNVVCVLDSKNARITTLSVAAVFPMDRR